MSAWIVPEAHINVIVNFFTKQSVYEGLYCKMDDDYVYINRDNAERLAEVLRLENIRSINSRYNEKTIIGDIGYEYLPQVRDCYSIAEIAQALNSYDYQSCETADYYDTQASHIINSMRKDLLRQLIDKDGDSIDTWCIDEVKTNGIQYMPSKVKR